MPLKMNRRRAADWNLNAPQPSSARAEMSSSLGLTPDCPLYLLAIAVRRSNTTLLRALPMNDTDPFQNASDAAGFYATAYRKFITLRGILDIRPNELIDPSVFKLPRLRQSFLAHYEAETAELYAQEAANRANELLLVVLGLKTWAVVLGDYEGKERYYLEIEFLWPLLELGIGAVGGIKNQVAFSVTKVAIQLESYHLSREIPTDKCISLGLWKAWAGHWRGAERFESALRAVNSQGFIAGTQDFRNRRMHAVAPTPFGILPEHIVTRKGRDWKMEVRYSARLDIAKLTDLLTHEHEAIVALTTELQSFLMTRFEKEPHNAAPTQR